MTVPWQDLIVFRHANAGTRTNQQERVKTERNITEEPQVLHQPAPYNLMSLRDLYTQIPDSPEKLKRFGSDVFLNRNAAGIGRSIGSTREMALDVPVGPDYVVGPGDGVTVSMWGGVSQSFARVIAVDGHISLPEAGDVQVAGLTLERVQTVIQSALKRQYRDVQVSVALSRLRTIRIYVVGDVQRPGQRMRQFAFLSIECALRRWRPDGRWLVAYSRTLSREATHRES